MRPRPRPDDGRPGWASSLGSGILLGCTICLVETAEQPLGDASWGDLWTFLSRLAPSWWAIGLGWAVVARWAESRLSLGGLVVACLLTTLAFGLASRPLDFGSPIKEPAGALRQEARTAHVLWTSLFYGSLYVAGYVMLRRSVRSRYAAARVRQARDEAAALLEESRLDRLRGQLHPATILHILRSVRAIHLEDPGRADELIAALVAFLRAAVRGPGNQPSTLSTEIELAARYIRMQRLAAPNATITAHISGAAPPRTPFPPNVLMPLIEGLCLGGAGTRLECGWNAADEYWLVVRGKGAAAETEAPALRRRLSRLTRLAVNGLASKVNEAPAEMTWAVTARVRPEATQSVEMTL
jgi:hypothetical protein